MAKQTISSYTAFGRWTRKYSWWMVIGMLISAAVLVLAGVILIIIGKPEHQKTLFKIAKFLGAGGTALGSLKAFWKEIQEKYALIRLQQATGHVIICGLGDKGMRLVDTLGKKLRLVVIEAKKDHPDISGCRERGVLVLIGDASDRVMLDEANTARAKFLFAITGNDQTNIEIAYQGRLLAEAVHKEGESTDLHCYTHIANSSLRSIFARHDLFARTYDEFDASIFNIFETAARVILEKYPPDIFARRQDLSGDTFTIVVIGFGNMGENIVKQIARIGHYAEWKRIEIVVVDCNIKGSSEKFLAVYGDGKTSPSFVVPGVEIRFVDRDPECLSSLEEIMGAPNGLPVVVYIALDDDSIGVSIALRVRVMLGSDATPVVACMRSSLSKLMEGKDANFTSDRNVYGFNILDAACGYQVLMEEVTDELAQTIHSAYVNTQIPFTKDDFTTSSPLELLHAITHDISGLPDIDEHDSIASLNRILKLLDIYVHLRKKFGIVLTPLLEKLIGRSPFPSGKTFQELTITEQSQLLRLNASTLEAAYPMLYPDGKRKNKFLLLWKELDEVMKDANRWSADHLSVKLRAIGCDGVDMSPLDQAVNNPAIFENLSEMEHRRWMAERLMDGWRYGPKRDNARKIHHLLVPYDQLSESEKNKDKDMIQNIRNLVAGPGWRKQREFLGTDEMPTFLVTQEN